VSAFELGRTIVAAVVGAGAVVGALVGLYRHVYRPWRPVRVRLRIRMTFDGTGRDAIIATVTNLSREDQVVVRCVARSTYPMSSIVRAHLRHPLTRPRLYPNIWYAPLTFDLMTAAPVTLKPLQPAEFHTDVKVPPEHPLFRMTASMIQAHAELSTGRTIRSDRLEVPDRWRLAVPRRKEGT
jgi:hypothetical protein